eukprot:5511850-Prymnesium_polylepis.1
MRVRRDRQPRLQRLLDHGGTLEQVETRDIQRRDRDAEKQYLDELPAAPAAPGPEQVAKKKEPPE